MAEELTLSELRKFAVFVTYEQPSMDELMRQFSGDIDISYKGNRFNPTEPCRGVSMVSRKVTVECFYVNCDMSTEEVLAEMRCLGLRPALYEELISFAKKYPDVQSMYTITALGSEIETDGPPCFACLCPCDADDRSLGVVPSDTDWSPNYDTFLAVRE